MVRNNSKAFILNALLFSLPGIYEISYLSETAPEATMSYFPTLLLLSTIVEMDTGTEKPTSESPSLKPE